MDERQYKDALIESLRLVQALCFKAMDINPDMRNGVDPLELIEITVRELRSNFEKAYAEEKAKEPKTHASTSTP